jgi:hypothetical protein
MTLWRWDPVQWPLNVLSEMLHEDILVKQVMKVTFTTLELTTRETVKSVGGN